MTTALPGALERLRRLLPAAWLGWMLCVGLLATPAAFALLARADAGRVVARILAQEAATSLAFGAVLLLLERVAARRRAAARQGPQFTTPMLLALGTLFCTVAGYYALQPLMAAARAGHGALSFGQLHVVSTLFYVAKAALVAALAWLAARPADPGAPGVSPAATSS